MQQFSLRTLYGYFSVCLILVNSPLFAQQKPVVVFQAGEAGYHTFRIPAIIRHASGALLAFCEGRKANSSDFGDIDIVTKQSEDGGITWGPLQVVVDRAESQAGNPAPVLDQLDTRYPKGRILLFYNTGNQPENTIRKGIGMREVWYISSTDGGMNWETPVNITAQVHHPAALEPSGADWRSYANTPGHALQIMQGPYRGRIVVAANHSAGDPLPRFKEYRAHVFFTNDHANSFSLGSNVSFEGSNESMAAELANGGILLNTRNQSGEVRARIISRSNNGGVNWDTTYYERSLIDPVNQGAVLTLGFKKGKAIVVSSHTQDSLRRNHLMLHISHNDGYNWEPVTMIDATEVATPKDYTAYSDLVQISKRQIGVLYERNQYKEIVFTSVQFSRSYSKIR
ncbi:MAG: sialidase family protein [Bacteroidetes bacterium]|nr:sialidase family protein [Bacteroidota bacterium]